MNKEALQFWCESESYLNRVPIRLYDENKLVKSFSVAENSFDAYSFHDEELLNSKTEYNVQLYFSPHYYMYGKISDKYSLSSIIIGPVSSMKISNDTIRDLIFELNLSLDDCEIIKTMANALPLMRTEIFIAYLTHLNTQINHDVLNPEYLNSKLSWNKNEEIINQQLLESIEEREDNVTLKHIPREYEDKFLYCITNGLVDELKLLNYNDFSGKPGKLAFNPLRQLKNLLEVMNTLCIRAAMAGGMDSEIAYTIGELYAQRIELCNDYEQLNTISSQIRLDYCQRVFELKYPKSDDLTIKKALKFIHAHLTEKITTSDIAESLGMSREYLSTRFKKVTGKSVTDYINEQKIREAKALLRFSDKSLVTISNYLSFSSQSYFQNLFKKYVGMTPVEYKKSRSEK